MRVRGAIPPVVNEETDLRIPRSAWSTWKEAGCDRQLRRPLAEDEVRALEARRRELEPWVGAYHEQEQDDVALALVDMLGGFSSMQSQSPESAAARTEAIAILLRREEMPKWAIEKACSKIRSRGYVRTGEGGKTFTERHWPPSDPELVEMVRVERALYRDAYDGAGKLLAATVEEPPEARELR